MRSSGPRGESIVFPDILSARGRLTRRWASVNTANCRRAGASTERRLNARLGGCKPDGPSQVRTCQPLYNAEAILLPQAGR
jgi:hypothetical protein